MKNSMFPLICTLAVVALVGMAYTGLIADQADWTAQSGAGGCTVSAVPHWPPGFPPSCARNCDVNDECRDTTSTGYDGFCANSGQWTNFQGRGTEETGVRQINRYRCTPDHLANGDCVCKQSTLLSEGRKLRRCLLTPC